MKQILFLFALLFLMCSCRNNAAKKTSDQGVVFAPKQSETVVDKRQSNMNDNSSPIAFEGCVKMMIILPEGLPSNSESLLKNKILSMTSINNIGAIDGSPTFVIVPTFAETNYEITSTTPPKHKVNYSMSIYIANLKTGDLVESTEKNLIGVGDSKELAISNAINNINPADDLYQKMLQSAQGRIISFYESNADQFISEANSLSQINEYEEALSILNSIPSACSFYKKALAAKDVILKKYFEYDASVLISHMKSALAKPRDNEEGYSEEFLALYIMLPPNSASKKEGDALFQEYQKSLDKAAAELMLKRQKEWEIQSKRQEAEIAAMQEAQKIEFEKYKIEMETKIAVEGQTALLEKYKKDASYNKLGWLWRKVLYIGKE